jgi:hypothetical protein
MYHALHPRQLSHTYRNIESMLRREIPTLDQRCKVALEKIFSEDEYTNEIESEEDWRFVVTPKFISEDYLVSDHGRVLSLPRYRIYGPNGRSQVSHKKFLPGCIMSPGTQPSGHQTITLSHEKELFRTHVHRLVAWTFLGPQPSDHYVRHLDGDPSNNKLENLAYGMPWENIVDTFGPGGATGTGIVVGSSLKRRIDASINGNGNPVQVLKEIVDLIEKSRASSNSLDQE